MCMDFGVVSGPMIASMVATAISTTMTIVGQVQQANAESRQAKYQAKVADYNVKMNEYRAQDALQRGAFREQQERQRTRILLGQMSAEQGGSGVIGGIDSGADVLAEAAEYGGRDAATQRVNAQQEAYGFQSQGALDASEASYARYRAGFAKSALPGQIAGTALSGASKMLSTAAPYWKGWQSDNQMVPPGSLGQGSSKNYWGY